MTTEAQLYAISPLDGRYSGQVTILKDYFSEYALFKYRIRVEIEYLIFLAENDLIPHLTNSHKKVMRAIAEKFSIADAVAIKKIEHTTRHDVKAVEYFLQNTFVRARLNEWSSYIHLGLTSEDTNFLAQSLILKDAHENCVKKQLGELLNTIHEVAVRYAHSPLIGRTHSQAAVPTTFGKQLAVFYARLKHVFLKIESYKFAGKINGAVGDLNVMRVIFPQKNWLILSKQLVSKFGLVPTIVTTQLLPYENWLGYFQSLQLINGILVDLCRDMWLYALTGEITLKKAKGQVGSSTMPQKVNPIDFENAEGNLEVANNYFELYTRKLSASRLQRDLSDSTVRRTCGTAIGHTILAWANILRGLKKLEFNQQTATKNLNDHWEVLTEAVQVYLRAKGDKDAYEKVRNLSQGITLGKEEYIKLLHNLGLENEKILAELTPETYIGYAPELTMSALKK